jgi:hypothetical protein
MAKRGSDKGNSIWLEEDLPGEIVSHDYEIIEEVPKTTRLVLLKDLILQYTGPISGNVYHFNRAGSIVDVDNKDVEAMLAKRTKSTCCPGSGFPENTTTPYFELAR